MFLILCWKDECGSGDEDDEVAATTWRNLFMEVIVLAENTNSDVSLILLNLGISIKECGPTQLRTNRRLHSRRREQKRPTQVQSKYLVVGSRIQSPHQIVGSRLTAIIL